MENAVGKGENRNNLHFLPFPRCFQKGFYFHTGVEKSSLFSEGLKFPRTILTLNNPNTRSLSKIYGSLSYYYYFLNKSYQN